MSNHAVLCHVSQRPSHTVGDFYQHKNKNVRAHSPVKLTFVMYFPKHKYLRYFGGLHKYAATLAVVAGLG